MSDALPALTKDELFARLDGGHAAQATVLTPNRRLAQALAAEFDHRQLTARRSAWDTPDILPFTAFVERLYDDALYSELGAGLPLLLTPDQEQGLWEEVVRRSGVGEALLAVPETAALAAEAWQLAHAWRLIDQLDDTPLDEDAAAFAEWARAYRERSARARVTDRARLPAVVAGTLGHAWVKKPELLVAYGFDVVTPQQRAFLEALAARGVALARCASARGQAAAVRLVALDARDEMLQAARWARARLEANGTARIGLVVPDLGARKHALRRVLAQTLDPGRSASVLPFNISLGDPLAGYPLVAHALAALALAGREIDFERASELIRSPFIAGAESEMQPRARLDARLRERAEPIVTLDRLVRMIDGAPALERALAAYAEFRKSQLFGARAPGEWARAFSAALSLVGFPGERGLDSTEYQTLKKWHDVLARFAQLDRVVAKLGFEDALARLGRMASETLFQPETPEVPVQVLGVLEAAGLAFDYLWVMGLSDEAWPAAAHPNPFLPLRLQRAAQVPNASPAAALERAQRLTAEWLGCTDEVVLSHARREEDRDLAPSPLIGHVAEGMLTLPEYETWRDAIHRAAKVERMRDAQATAVGATDAAHGGASLIKDQSACPFRAFAAHRLGAQGIESPRTGLDASERGTLVHRVLASAWRQLGSRRSLDAIGAAELDALLAAAADEAVASQKRNRPTTLAGRFAAIEKARLVRLARAWLEYERGRGDFAVVAVEDRRAVELGPLKLNVRLDRVDDARPGGRIVIDYKTGRSSAGSFLGARPEEPQLPLYLTAAERDAGAIAFAQVRAGDMKFVGLAREQGVLPGAKTPAEAGRSGAAATWDAQVAFWRAELERLAHEFAAGNAAVDPKRPAHTCRECDLQPLCRIHERAPGGAEAAE
jgi:probable DNA repair protein